MSTSFKDFLSAPSFLFKLPYWSILGIGAVYFLFVMGYDEAESTLFTRICAYLVVVGISYWMWKRKQSKKS